MQFAVLLLFAVGAGAQEAPPADPQPGGDPGAPVPDSRGLSASFLLTDDGGAVITANLPAEADHFEVLLHVIGIDDATDARWTQGPYTGSDEPALQLPDVALPAVGQTEVVLGIAVAFDSQDNQVSYVRLAPCYASPGATGTAFAAASVPVTYVDASGATFTELNAAGGE